MSHLKLEAVRQRYKFACGYCGVNETAVGGELTIDHFQPLSAGGDEEEQNLVYACMKCNQFKANYWPDREDLSRGRRVLHPMRDNISAHIIENELTGHLVGLTETGTFHLNLLRLNRPQLLEHRIAQSLLKVLNEKKRLLEQQNKELLMIVELQRRYIAMLEDQLDELV